jgi:hypothetical protein
VWHNTLQVVRDPLFGIALSLFLASGFAERLMRVVLIPDLDVQPLTDAALAPVFLPNRQDWAELTGELDLRLPYLALRVFCLKRDWRELATVLYKCYYGGVVLAECVDELDEG